MEVVKPNNCTGRIIGKGRAFRGYPFGVYLPSFKVDAYVPLDGGNIKGNVVRNVRACMVVKVQDGSDLYSQLGGYVSSLQSGLPTLLKKTCRGFFDQCQCYREFFICLEASEHAYWIMALIAVTANVAKSGMGVAAPM